MKTENITWVIVGADRITANGDVANKIGTYQLAVNAMHHGVRFMVVAPSSTIDMNLESGGTSRSKSATVANCWKSAGDGWRPRSMPTIRYST